MLSEHVVVDLELGEPTTPYQETPKFPDVDFGVRNPNFWSNDLDSIPIGSENSAAWACIGSEHRVMSPMKMYNPMIRMTKNYSRFMAQRLFRSKEFASIPPELIHQELLNDNKTNCHYDRYDPYQGNVLVFGHIDGQHFILRPMGERSTTLGVFFAEGVSSCTFDDLSDTAWRMGQIPSGKLSLHTHFDFQTPICEILLSSARDIPSSQAVIGVRTMSSTYLLRLQLIYNDQDDQDDQSDQSDRSDKSDQSDQSDRSDRSYQSDQSDQNDQTDQSCQSGQSGQLDQDEQDDEAIITQLHEYSPKKNEMSRFISMSLSPYAAYEYAVIDDQGHVVIVDGSIPASSSGSSLLIAEYTLPMHNVSQTFGDCWCSVAFGTHEQVLVVASSYQVMLLDARKRFMLCRALAGPSNGRMADSVKCTELYTCQSGSRIWAMTTHCSERSFEICISTTEAIVLLDSRYPHQPVVSWPHHLCDQPPTQIILYKRRGESLLFAWSSRCDRLISVRYTYRDAMTVSNNQLEPLSHRRMYTNLANTMPLAPHVFYYLDKKDIIPTRGLAILLRIAQCDHDKVLASIVYRVGEDGAMYAQPFVIQESNATMTNVDFPPLVLSDPDNDTRVREEDANERSDRAKTWTPKKLAEYLLDAPALVNPTEETSMPDTVAKGMYDQVNRTRLPTTLYEYLDGFPSEKNIQHIDQLLSTHPGHIPVASNLFNASPIFRKIKRRRSQDLDTAKEQLTEVSETFVSTKESRPVVDRLARELDAAQQVDIPTPAENDGHTMQPRYIPSFRHYHQWTPTATACLLAEEWVPGLAKNDNLAFGERVSDMPLFPVYHGRRRKQPPTVQFALGQATPHTDTFGDIVKSTEGVVATLPPTVGSSQVLPSPADPKGLSEFAEISTQPVSGSFANRNSTTPKKKKKKKVLGFK